MLMKCISSLGAQRITVGNNYDVGKATHSDYYRLKNDNGDIKSYCKSRFIDPQADNDAENHKADESEPMHLQCPVGTELWSMIAAKNNDVWDFIAASVCIRSSGKNGFSTRPVTIRNENPCISWNEIGTKYHKTKEECLKEWDDYQLKRKINKSDSTEIESKSSDYGKQNVYLDVVRTVYITVNHIHFDLESIKWHEEEESSSGFIIKWLSLDEIGDLINANVGHPCVIEVREESPSDGVIHATGKYPYNKDWYRQGTTRGYA